jgi:AcrR family transcriptional regulator
MNSPPTKNEGRRDRKKRETLRRIAETGLKLFIEKGYEGTTLEAIAAASGIARRTFFYYYKSKDEILMATLGGGMVKALRPDLLEQSRDQAPLNAVRNCLLHLTSLHETKESIIVDGLLRSTEALRARKQAIFVEMEQSVFDALCELWPQAKRRAAHRIVAMVSIGAMRVAMEAWRHDGGKKPLAKYLRESFATLESEI